MNDINNILHKAKLYKETFVFIYIKEVSHDGRPTYYNGFITEINKNYIKIFDIEITLEVPVLFENLKVIEPSRKFNVDYNSAVKIFKKYLESKNDDTKTTSTKPI